MLRHFGQIIILLILTFADQNLFGYQSVVCLSFEQREALDRLAETNVMIGPIPIKTGMDQVTWVSPGTFFQNLLSLTHVPHVLNNEGDLRFLPYVLPGTHILLITRNFTLPIEKVSKVVAVAKTFDVTINILWLGEAFVSPAKYIADRTGGSFYSYRHFQIRSACDD